MTDSKVKDGDYLVRVQAQVMTRDDSSGGWVPMGGGGPSNVGLRQIVISNGEDSHNEYLLHGERIADESVVLDCVLKKDTRYTKANPKFHHWQTDDKRFGLTFERSDDAKAFDRAIKRAIADLTEGLTGLRNFTNSEGDEDIFELLDLPISRKGSLSQSGSTTSTTTSSPTTQSPASINSGTPDLFHYTHPHANQHHLHRVHYISSSHRNTVKQTSPPNSNKSSSSKSDSVDSYGHDISLRDDPSISCKSDQVLLEPDAIDPYVVFNKNSPHEYSYPNLESVQKPPTKRESTSSVKKIQFPNSPPLPVRKKKDKSKSNQRGSLIKPASCKHCHELFNYSENQRGSCEEAPDSAEKAIELISCVMCAKGLIYHCMSDADGEYGHPCACDSADESNSFKKRRAAVLVLRHSEFRARVRTDDVALRVKPQSCIVLRNPWDSDKKEPKRRILGNEINLLETTTSEIPSEISRFPFRNLQPPLNTGACGSLDLLLDAGLSLRSPDQSSEIGSDRPSLNWPLQDESKTVIAPLIPTRIGSNIPASLSVILTDSGENKLEYKTEQEHIEQQKRSGIKNHDKVPVENSKSSESEEEDSQKDLIQFTSGKSEHENDHDCDNDGRDIEINQPPVTS